MNSEFSCGVAKCAGMARPKKPRPPGPYAATGWQVRVLREATKEPTDAAFAQRVGISPPHLANIMSGDGPLTVGIDMKICAAVPGVTLDWLYGRGRVGMDYDLVPAIEEAERKLKTSDGLGSPTTAPGRRARVNASRT